MKFQVGDKVKFLNEKGGGVVSRILDPSTVEVTIDEGFDMPVKVSELIMDPASVRPAESKPVPEIQQVPVHRAAPEVPVGAAPQFLKQVTAVHLAFRPQKAGLPGGYTDVLLINRTPHDLLYNIFHRKNGKYSGADYGNAEPESITILDSCDTVGLEIWCQTSFQLMFHPLHADDLIPPVAADFRVKTGKLFKEDAYQPSALLDAPAYVHPLFVLPRQETAAITTVQSPSSRSDQALIARYRTDEGEAEVDLHLHALVEDARGMDATAMMHVQLDHLSRCLESAIAARYRKVVFIHGVGAGVLKIEMRKILESYDFIEFFDASIARYGIGATEVLIHHSRK